MKRKLPLLALLLFCFGVYLPAWANHFLGGEIGYISIAPGIVIAEFKGYYDCAAVPPSATLPLSIKSPGCSTALTVTANLQSGPRRSLDPYCRQFGNTCGSAARLNIVEAKYQGTITLPTQCPEWVLSFQDCSKPPVTNLVSSGANCFYVEAYINTAISQPVSPEFFPMPTYLVTVNSPAAILNLASKRGTEDSLVYTLKPAMTDLNTPAAYKPNFSFTNFVPSANGVQLNPNTGLLTFLPNVFNSQMGYDANAYTFVVEAAAYKKLNGVMTKISSTQRNMQVLIDNFMPNQNPEVLNATANGTPMQPNDIIKVRAGDPLTFQFSTSDGNTSDSVSVVMQNPANPYMPWNITFNATNAQFPTGTFTWDTNNASPGDLVYFPVIVKDNACPVRGVGIRMYGVKILPRTTGIRQNEMAPNSFTAFPNPFSEELTFNLNLPTKAESIQIYNLVGQQIAEIPLKTVGVGAQKVLWQNAGKYAAGTYVAKLIAQDKTTQTLKFTKLN